MFLQLIYIAALFQLTTSKTNELYLNVLISALIELFRTKKYILFIPFLSESFFQFQTKNCNLLYFYFFKLLVLINIFLYTLHTNILIFLF